MNVIAERKQSFWHRPISKRATKIALAVAWAALILGEGWIGRKRLFVLHDRNYLLAFLLYTAVETCLLGVLTTVTAKLKRENANSKSTSLQVWSGVICGLAVAISDAFGDYTVHTFNFPSVAGSVVTGLILGIVMAASTERSVSTETH
jgi:hypothetical protein